eukprot:793632-Prorocentrum_minimum.AAC.1
MGRPSRWDRQVMPLQGLTNDRGGREHIPDVGSNHKGEESIFLMVILGGLAFSNPSSPGSMTPPP